jgi:Cdc6-like AAA superfamily ATPase
MEAFTGREDILAQMRDCFFNGSRKRNVFVLYGLGGAGKTQIALKFVEMCQEETVPRLVPFLHICICVFGLIVLPV